MISCAGLFLLAPTSFSRRNRHDQSEPMYRTKQGKLREPGGHLMDAAESSTRAGGASTWDAARFDRFAGTCAIALAAGGIAYSGAFVVYLKADSRPALFAASLLLAGSGIISTVIAIAIYEHVRGAGGPIALWGLVLGLLSAAGATIHGAYDLANVINPPDNIPQHPNAVDPRGLLTFGIAAASVAVFSWLISEGGTDLPKRLGRLGYLAAALLAIVYLGRLIILDADNLILLGSAAIAGLVVVPWWYVWLGMTLRRESGRTHA
jgi:hypothetical protein